MEVRLGSNVGGGLSGCQGKSTSLKVVMGKTDMDSEGAGIYALPPLSSTNCYFCDFHKLYSNNDLLSAQVGAF